MWRTFTTGPHWNITLFAHSLTRSELRSCTCESRGGRPGLPVPINPYGFCGRKATLNSNTHRTELRRCVKVEVAVLGSPSLTVLIVSVGVKQHWTRASSGKELRSCVNAEVDVLGSPSLKILMVYVDVNKHWTLIHLRADWLTDWLAHCDWPMMDWFADCDWPVMDWLAQCDWPMMDWRSCVQEL